MNSFRKIGRLQRAFDHFEIICFYADLLQHPHELEESAFVPRTVHLSSFFTQIHIFDDVHTFPETY